MVMVHELKVVDVLIGGVVLCCIESLYHYIIGSIIVIIILFIRVVIFRHRHRHCPVILHYIFLPGTGNQASFYINFIVTVLLWFIESVCTRHTLSHQSLHHQCAELQNPPSFDGALETGMVWRNDNEDRREVWILHWYLLSVIWYLVWRNDNEDRRRCTSLDPPLVSGIRRGRGV